MDSYIVRRLTPRECERLQGFPDDWTKIDEDAPDTPRYKALGNSMAVPCMRWIGERIQMVDDMLGGEDVQVNGREPKDAVQAAQEGQEGQRGEVA